MTRSPARILKRVSLCSSLAIATSLILGPSPAAAQSFEANNVAPLTTNGAIVTTSPGVTNIALQSGQTVIDWTPNDTAISGSGIGFQYGGTATFSSANNFAVLNRINPVDPTRLISMDGNIVSTVGGQTGGAVYFYSPAGIVLGPNALINVGSLVLTTSPIAVTAGQFIGGVDGTTVKFGNSNPNSFVFTNPGSTINTLNNGSYVAMVAPRVVHNGTINVNGAAALVAAEAATISFNTDGLFNITVDVGTAESQNEGIEVNGTITGPASSGAGDYHRVYLVAVPKNTLLTMAIGSGADLGFDIAGAANVVGNAVVLSAGHDISFGSTSEAPSAAAGALANINLTNNNFTSALYGRASGEANVGASGGGSSTFASDVSLRAGSKVAFTSGNPGSTVTVGGNLTLSANANGLTEGDSATAGIVQLNVFNGGSLSVAGNTTLSAVGTGGFSANPLVASGNGTGGTILVQSTTGSDLSLGGNLNADASGYGGSYTGLGTDGGDGIGGTVNVLTTGASSLSVAGATYLRADGTAGGPGDCSACGGVGGIGDGGTINVNGSGSGNSMDFANILYMWANGYGGTGETGNGGAGLGGNAALVAGSGTAITVAGDVAIQAYGYGGGANGPAGGGVGLGGSIQTTANGGTLSLGANLQQNANGLGGYSSGGNGTGGASALYAWNGGTVTLTGVATLSANGEGGSSGTAGVDAGNGVGGYVTAQPESGGSMTVGGLNLRADGYGGYASAAGVNGGDGTGGNVFLHALGVNSTLQVNGTSYASASGYGGSGDDGACTGCDGAGGVGTGGTVRGGAAVGAGAKGTFNGPMLLFARGYGGSAGTGAAGAGTGGLAELAFDDATTVTVNGDVTLNSDGTGGASQSGAGGAGTGGTADINQIYAQLVAGSTTINGNAFLSASGYGGQSDSIGGAGVGGSAFALPGAGTLDITGNFISAVDGTGGYSPLGIGGDGTGGFARLGSSDSGGDTTVGGVAYVSAYGQGGDGQTGGHGFGGNANFWSDANGSLTLGSFASLSADGYGGYAFDGVGGVGTGGSVGVYSANATIDFSGTLSLSANGRGGGAEAPGSTSGDGVGGDINVQVAAGGAVTVAGALYADANGIGGNTNSLGVNGGDGFGGTVNLLANGGNATLALSNAVFLSADGEAGSGGECIGCGGAGGDGFGGTIYVDASGASTNSITMGGALFMSADGYGGIGISSNAGDGFGGTVNIGAHDGASLSVTGDLFASADGHGGDHVNGGLAGDGTGGQAVLGSGGAGSSVSLTGSVFLAANGNGGNGLTVAGATGGTGTGGHAYLLTAGGGALDVAGDVYADGLGFGGNAYLGIGGDGIGYAAEIVTLGGDIIIGGSAFLDASGQGGNGNIGGDGVGGGQLNDGGALIHAQNGDITIGIAAYLTAAGYGGDGTSGLGGAGGNGTGGGVAIQSINSDLGPSSVTIPLAYLDASGFGGSGGTGASANSGGDGGNGGSGTGGLAISVASAGNGAVTINDIFVAAQGVGGDGGDGGDGDTGSGGNGGAGGEGIGGDATVGTRSGNAQAATQTGGIGDYGNIVANVGALGGNGGAGGLSGGPAGNGGAGGNATAGNALLQVRGSTVNADTVGLFADATGGDGGLGTTQGAGGNAIGGSIGVEVTQRFLLTQRGQLNAGSIIGTADAVGGNGSTNGASLTGGGSRFFIRQGDAAIGSLDFSIVADGVALGAPENVISIVDGDVTMAGDFSFITPGDMSLFANNGSMTVGGTLTLTAGNFVPDATGEPPTNAGTYFANLINITSGLNIYTTANLDSILGLNLNAAGFVVAGNLNGHSGDVIVDAQGGLVDVGNVDGGFVNIQATDSVTTGDITSDSNIQVTAGAGMTLGDLVAGVTIDPNSNKAIRLNAIGSILTGDMTALGGIDFSAGGSVTGGDITTGDVLNGDADGAVIFGAISAGLVSPQGLPNNGFSVGFSSGTSISVGDVAGADGVGFATLGALTTGDITAGTDVLALASGNMSLGAITAGPAGRTYLADSSMFTAAGGPDNFDPSLVFVATPVASAGSISIGGPVSTGSFQAAGASISTGNVNAGTFIEMLAGGNINFGALVAGTYIDVDAGGGINGGNLDVGTFLSLVAGSGILVGDIIGGTGTVLLDAQGGAITAGDISGGTIDLSAFGAIGAGNILTSGDFGVTSLNNTLTFGNIDAVGFVSLEGTSVSAGSIDAGDSVFVDATGPSGSANVGNVVAGTSVHLEAGGAIDANNVTAGTSIEMFAGGNIDFGALVAGSFIDVSAGGDLTGGNLLAQTSIALDAGDDLTIGNATAQTGSFQASAVDNLSFLDIIAGTFVTIDPTAIVGGDVTALAGDVNMTGGSIDIGNVSASDDVLLTALAGDLSTGTINAGFDVTLDATGDVTTGNITAGGLIDATGASLTLGNLSANSIDLTTTVADLTVGNVTIPGNLSLATAGDLIFGDINAFDVDLAATGSISGGDVDSVTHITALAGVDIDVGNLTAGGFDGEVFQLGDIALTAGGGITAATLSAFSNVDMTANGGALQFGDASAFGVLTGTASGNILGGAIGASDISLDGNGVTTGNLSANNNVTVDAAGSIVTGTVETFGDVEMDAVGDIATGYITASTIDLFAGGDIATGDLTTQIVAQFGGEFTALLFPGASITLESGGDVSTGAIDSRDGVYANAGGGIATGSIDAVDFVQLLAGAAVATGDIFAGGFIDIFSTGGGIATGDLTGTEVDLEADGDIDFGNVDADSFDFDATGSVDGGNITAFSQVNGDAAGAVTLGDINVGPGASQPDDFSVGIASATSITVGDVSGTDRVGFATLGDLTTGDLSASDLVMTLVGGNVVTGSITTAANGNVYIADASMFLDAGGPDDFNASFVLAAAPVATDGSITINGPVSTGLFRAAAGTGLTTGAIGASTIEASAGGTATLNGVWSAKDVTLASNDIDIGATGGIAGASSGLVTLISTNATQALIGDGLTGSGYALSNAEFGRIEGGSVYVLARGDASAAQDMLIGDLTVTGPSLGSTIENSAGILVFATGDIDGETPGGVIRVVGDVIATGFGSGNAMEFYADRFELDAATGGISITSSGGALSGELGLYAGQIHVAEASVLDQLAANPQYDGYQDDLNAPAAVQRPEGLLNAATIWIESDNLQNILVQNTGTEEMPAGFLAQEIFVNDDKEIAGPPGSIDLVVNGQLQTEGGTLTGIAVRDALVEGENLTPFTDNSTINGCELVGDCSDGGPLIGLPTEFSLIIDSGLPELPFDGDEASSAIQAPPALFDTRPLDPDGTVDEPISGSGNPALIGSGPAGGDEQCAAAGTEENRQCTPATNSGDQR